MWNDRKSLLLSKGCVLLFIVLIISGVAVMTRYQEIVTTIYLASLRGLEIQFMITVYFGAAAALVLLALLYVLLRRIGEGEVFVRKNVGALRYISWCCIAGAFIAAVSAAYWIPWLAVAVSAAFMGLIVRVVKNVFAKAVSLQDDAEFTI